MIVQRVRGLNLLHFTIQTSLMVGLFWIWAFCVYCFGNKLPFDYHRCLIYSLCIVVAFVLELGRSNPVSRNLLHLDFLRNHARSFKQAVVVAGTLLFFLVAAKDQTVSRIFLFSYLGLLYISLFLSNQYLPRLLAAFVFNDRHQQRTVLVGTPANANKLNPWLQRKSCYGLRVIGLITNDLQSSHQETIPVLGPMRKIANILRDTHATQVILLDLPMAPDEIAELGALSDKLGVRLLIVNDLEDKLHRTIRFTEDDGFHFICFRQEPLECPVGRLVKRMFDVLLSLPVVVFVLPITNVMVWLLQRQQSPGPLFYTQPRSGKHHNVFQIIKYRTMHINHGQDGLQATVNDSRIFAAGKWLRKLSIDELPQFVNVLKGEMSIVGPRPHFVEHDVLFGEIANYYRVRSFIKPGITGLAQVRGLRGEARQQKDLVDRIHSDLYYIENWSILLDWTIIAKTAWQMMVPPKTAY